MSNMPCCFDIEASSFYMNGKKHACMYAWVFGLNGEVCRGRTWKEFIDLLNTFTETYNLSPQKRLIVYIHNLSYEFQWFRKYFEWHTVFATDARKPLYAVTTSGIEFRCSYLLSGYSLEKLGENLTKYKVKKKVGDLDYKLIHHSRTPLTETEWGYIMNDALVVMAHIQEEIERLGDIGKIPLTKTGYVRNLCREKCLKGDNRWEFTTAIKHLTLTTDTYKQAKRAYTGGFTHANINYVDRIINDVDSFDFTSSYPAVMCSEMFPMSKPFKYEPKNFEELCKYLKAFCCMIDITFYNLIAKVDYENYISSSRCTYLEHYYCNNGRIVEADVLSITITEQDFFIIDELYDYDGFDIHNMQCMYKDYLPKDFVLAILELYKDKTELKGIPEKEVEYLVSKGMINSCYGMAVTDPCRDENTYTDTWEFKKGNIDELIEKYNKDRQRFLYYPWGVWVTAYARRNLFSGIIEFKEDYIYSDTDSIKVRNADKHQEYIKKYNIEVTEKIRKCLEYHGIPFEYSCPKTITGKSKPLGVWDYEGRYDTFKTLGAKRYITEQNGEISITIAGVSKEAGKRFLKHKYKTNEAIFEAFREDMYFPPSYDRNGIEDNASGKLCHTYIDDYIEGEVTDYLGNTYIYNEQSCIHMENTDYTLGLNTDFKNLILGIKGGHIV